MKLNKDFLVVAVAFLVYCVLSFAGGGLVHAVQTVLAVVALVFLIRGLIRLRK